MFDQETKMQERLHSDHMRALALEDRKMRFRDQQAQEHERMLHARRSATELRLKADDERRRAEFEAYRAGMRAGHHHSVCSHFTQPLTLAGADVRLQPLRPRHHSGYLPPSGASHLLHPPSTHHLRPSPPYQSRPPHQPPLLMPPPGPSPPHYHRRSSSMAGLDPPPAFRGHHRPTGSIPGTPRHPPPLTSLHPPATPRQRRISDPGLGLRTSHRF